MSYSQLLDLILKANHTNSFCLPVDSTLLNRKAHISRYGTNQPSFLKDATTPAYLEGSQNALEIANNARMPLEDENYPITGRHKSMSETNIPNTLIK